MTTFNKTEIYSDLNNIELSISYSGRFERQIDVNFHQDFGYKIRYSLDKAVTEEYAYGEEDKKNEWMSLAYYLLTKDSSGNFYILYWLPVIAIILLFHLGNKLIEKLNKTSNQALIITCNVTLLIMSVLISLRLIW